MLQNWKTTPRVLLLFAALLLLSLLLPQIDFRYVSFSTNSTEESEFDPDKRLGEIKEKLDREIEEESGKELDRAGSPEELKWTLEGRDPELIILGQLAGLQDALNQMDVESKDLPEDFLNEVDSLLEDVIIGEYAAPEALDAFEQSVIEIGQTYPDTGFTYHQD